MHLYRVYSVSGGEETFLDKVIECNELGRATNQFYDGMNYVSYRAGAHQENMGIVFFSAMGYTQYTSYYIFVPKEDDVVIYYNYHPEGWRPTFILKKGL